MTRVKTAHSCVTSRYTSFQVFTTAKLLELGIQSACIDSEIRYSRSIDFTVALPSHPLEKGVLPEPLSTISKSFLSLVSHSHSSTARPSPSIVGCPNWWPAYACAIGLLHSIKTFHESTSWAFLGEITSVIQSVFANSELYKTHSGLPDGSGFWAAKKIEGRDW